ncbi:hypothetical protein D9M73_239670 [compost metagenome]
MIQQLSTRQSRREPLRVMPHEQLDPQFVLKLGNPGRYGGGGYIYLMRRRSDAARFAHRDEIFQLPQCIAKLHRPSGF